MIKKITLERDEKGGVHIEYIGVKKNDVLVMTAALIVHIASVFSMAIRDVVRVVYMTTKRITESEDDTATGK